MDCSEELATVCNLCYGPVCASHRALGSSKPDGWPKLSGGMHVYCRDRHTCFLRWARMRNMCANYD